MPNKKHTPAEVVARLRQRIVAVGAKTAFIEPGGPWENRTCERFNSKLSDDFVEETGMR